MRRAWKESIARLFELCTIIGLFFGSMNYTKELKTVECTSFLSQTS